MAEEREFGVATNFDFPLVVFGSTDADFSTGVTFDVSAGDIRFSLDGSTFNPISTTTPSQIGINSGIYTLALTSTETTGARGMLLIIDQTATKIWEDQAIIFNTYGSTLGQHAFNRNSTGVNVNSIDVGAITSTSIVADAFLAEKFAADALTTASIAAGVFTKVWAESTRSITLLDAGSITSTAFAVDAILSTAIGDGALVAAKFGIGFITSTGFAAGAINSTAIATDTIIAEKIGADAITAAKIASNALTTDEIAAGVFTKMWAESTRSLTTLGIGLITSTSIEDAAITSAKFAASAIDAAAIASNALTTDEIDAGVFTKFWAESTRSLTALGFALAASDFGTDALSTAVISTGVMEKIRDNIMPTQNAAFNNIEFLFVGSTDHVTPVTGTTGIGTRSIDGSTFVAVEGTIAEVSRGIYQFDATSSDMDGGIITFRFTGGVGDNSCGPDDRFVTIVTGGGV